MRESDIERKLMQAVRQSGGLALKFVSPGFDGVPNRFLLFLMSRIAFCKVKVPGREPRPLRSVLQIKSSPGEYASKPNILSIILITAK